LGFAGLHADLKSTEILALEFSPSSLILYPRLSQPMRQSGLMGALRTVFDSIDAEN
jgi:hypothetical protein